jgi:hypothetical protein
MATVIIVFGCFTVSPCFDFLNHPIGVAGLSMKHRAASRPAKAWDPSPPMPGLGTPLR